MVNKKVIGVVFVVVIILVIIQLTTTFWSKHTGGWPFLDSTSSHCGWASPSGIPYTGDSLKNNSYESVKAGKTLCNKTADCTGFGWYNTHERPSCLNIGGKPGEKASNRPDVDSYVKRHGPLGLLFGF